MAELEQGLEELKEVKQAFKDNISANNVSTSNVEFRNMPDLLKQMEKKLPAQTKDINPTTSSQIVTADSGYKLSQVNVGAVNPADYYKPEQSLDITPKTTAQTITSSGNSVYNRVNVSAVTSAIDSNLIPTNIRKGKTILGVVGNLEADKPDQQKTISPKTSEQVVVADNGYELAKVTVNAVTSSIDNNIQAGNIKKGVSILGVTGSLESTSSTTPVLQEKSVNPTTSKQSVIADAGYDGLSKVNVEAVVPSEYYKPEEVANVTPTTNQQVITPSENSVFSKINVSAVTSAIDGNIKSENIKEGVSILGVVGSMQATSGSPKFSELVNGTIESVTEEDLKDITSIRDGVFSGLSITNVEIPSNVTTIGDSAFANNQISELSLSDGVVTIGDSAFANNQISELTIPQSVTAIGDSAFATNPLTEITMESDTPPVVTSTTFPSALEKTNVSYNGYPNYVADSNWQTYEHTLVRGLAIPSSITITVNNYLGELVNGAIVTIEGSGQSFTGVTNENGVFAQGELQPATYTIIVADLDGFKTPDSIQIVVEENTENTVTITYLEKPSVTISSTFSENTPEAIAYVSEEIARKGMTSAEVEATYGWKISDYVRIQFSNGIAYPCSIIGVNHDVKSDGSGKAGLTLFMNSCLPTRYAMNSTNTNKGGYASSVMRTSTLPTIKAMLPQEWQNVIKMVDKKSANGGGSNYSETITTSEDVFLLSTVEVYGTTRDAAQDQFNEGTQYERFVGASNSTFRKYYDKNGDGSVDTQTNWASRSCSNNQTNYFVEHGAGSSGGTVATNNADSPVGVAIAFCV